MTAEWPPKTDKSPAMQRVVSDFAGVEGNAYDRADCVICAKVGLQPGDFRDDLSRAEFGISRMCQDCQDKVFGK
jgi:hypothetical protein